MSESRSDNPRRPGTVRTWIGVGLFGVGALLTFHSMEKSTNIDHKGDVMNAASDRYNHRLGQTAVFPAVYKYFKATEGETAATLIAYEGVMPRGDGKQLAAHCQEGLLPKDGADAVGACEALGDAKDDYDAAAKEFDDSMPTTADMVEVGTAVGSLVVGVGLGASGLRAGRRAA